MELEVVGHEVLKVERVKTSKQNAIIKSHFDMKFHIKISADKNEILSDGIDKAVITATIYNYENIFQSTFSGDIIFEVEGVTQTVKAVEGKASTSITSTTPGEIKIKASAPKFRDGEVLVNAV